MTDLLEAGWALFLIFAITVSIYTVLDLVRAADLSQLEGAKLDAAGARLLVKRREGETDRSYRARMLAEIKPGAWRWR